MQSPINQEALQEKWSPLLDYEGLDPIKDHHRAVTAVLLENQEQTMREKESSFLSNQQTAQVHQVQLLVSLADASGAVAGFDPVLISLIRRSMPNLVAYDLAGVQPMSGSTGLIFAMRSRFTSQSGTEALFNEPDTSFSAQDDGRNLVSSGYTQNEGASQAVMLVSVQQVLNQVLTHLH